MINKQIKKIAIVCDGCYKGIKQELQWGRAGPLNEAVREGLDEMTFQHEGQEGAH